MKDFSAVFIRLTLILLISLQAIGQQDSAKVAQLQKQAFEVIYSEPGQAKKMVLQGLSISQKIKHHLLEASCFNQLGIVYDVTSKYDSALYCYRKAIEISEEHGHIVMKGQALNNIGLIYWNMGELDRAIDHYTQSLVIFEDNENQKGVANTLSNIGALYTDKREYQAAIPYHMRAVKAREALNDKYGLSVSYANLGKLYLDFEKNDSARYFMEQSIKLKDSLNDRRGLAINYSNLGVVYKRAGQLDSAIWAITLAKNIRLKLGDKASLAAEYSLLGGLYMELRQYTKAYTALDSAEYMALEMGNKIELINIYARLAAVDTLTGDYQAAVRHMAKRIEAQYDFYDIEQERVIKEVQTRYDTERKERELAESKVVIAEEQLKVRQRTTWAIVAAAAFILLIVIGINIYRQQKLKEQKLTEESRLRDELARAELQARIQDERVRISRDLHDHIGSQLTIISSVVDNLAFAEGDDERKEALYAISDTGRETMLQLRETIWAMNQKVIDLETLKAKTQEFISRLSLDDRQVTVLMKADDDLTLSPVMAINLYRIVQEAVNNAVKYAGFNQMEISFTKSNGSLTIEIKDDGRGFELNETTEKGYGLINIKERARQFGGDLHLTTQPGEGTHVVVVVPLNQSNYV
jgi:signal transduction histidine kinase